MDARTKAVKANPVTDDQPTLPFDDLNLVGQQLPLTSSAMSGLCLHSTAFHALNQDNRLRTLFATLFTDPNTDKLASNLQAIGKLLQIRPDLVHAKIDLNATPLATTPEEQIRRNQAIHYNFLICLINAAGHADGAPWVKPVLTCLANNQARFDGRNEYGMGILHCAVKCCASDVITFLYDHQLVDTTTHDPYLLDILQTDFSQGNSNWGNRKTNILHRMCIEHPYLFFREGNLIDSRHFAIFCYYLNLTYQISNRAYCDDRFYLTQFYLHQLTEITPLTLFNQIIQRSSSILEKDIPKLLNGTLSLTNLARLPEILKLILLTDYNQSHRNLFKTIGFALYQHALSQPLDVTTTTEKDYLMLSATFICMAGSTAMREPPLAAILRQLIDSDDKHTLDDWITESPSAVLTCIDHLLKFYSVFTDQSIDALDAHPFSALQNHARAALNQQLLAAPSLVATRYQ